MPIADCVRKREAEMENQNPFLSYTKIKQKGKVRYCYHRKRCRNKRYRRKNRKCCQNMGQIRPKI